MTTTDGTTAGAVTVEVRYFAAAAEAAGCDTEQVHLVPGTTVGELLDALGARHGAGLADVAARCALLVDGVLHRDRTAALGEPGRVDVLPPFAGG
ncbi:thiamineS protein [Cellulomonas flavigena DSM 20109]|uniref:Molybdopterin synthase sulfur carrier subunit n=1 Tax=Cellulomonas flavigena (strain ATCC 482 / DSM 20109 / BCRC 11376 / JCM 18109 / NBRC 3775 / NCIMB 8073 / NRS 134) TaxID=446466 RepID=D5UEJ1_CELFN|nr:MoaD/ThiS family protein [Cellulomonas flavigena]ADG74651.1 thiamineS protein [Cellulomonas flavigena DSM 20109]